MSTAKVKAGALWGKDKDELTKQLSELKTELNQLRIQKIASSGTKLNKIHDLRKSIARVLTVINLKQRSQLRLFYKNKTYLPLDLRAKQTRAIRRQLSKEDASRVLEKTRKRQQHFSQRTYFVKVGDPLSDPVRPATLRPPATTPLSGTFLADQTSLSSFTGRVNRGFRSF
ncbi:hypothetical protein RB596_007013 [Gaeumannomyces avenae]